MASPGAGTDPAQRPSRVSVPPRPDASKRARLFGEPLLLGLAAIVVVFGAYELIETTLLAGADLSTIRAAHIARGVTSSIAAALVVGWSLVKRSPALLGQKPAAARPEQAADVLADSAQWYLYMRWIAIVGVVAASILAVPVAGLLPRSVLWPLLAGALALGLTNVAYAVLLGKVRSMRRLLNAQIHADLVIFAFLLHFGGGLENPIYVLPLVHVVLAGVLLPPRQCHLAAA